MLADRFPHNSGSIEPNNVSKLPSPRSDVTETNQGSGVARPVERANSSYSSPSESPKSWNQNSDAMCHGRAGQGTRQLNQGAHHLEVVSQRTDHISDDYIGYQRFLTQLSDLEHALRKELDRVRGEVQSHSVPSASSHREAACQDLLWVEELFTHASNLPP